MTETASAWRFTFESFLVEDDGVVLWRLCQAEELTAGREEEEKREEQVNKQCYSGNNQPSLLVFLIWVAGNLRRVGVEPASFYCLQQTQGKAPN